MQISPSQEFTSDDSCPQGSRTASLPALSVDAQGTLHVLQDGTPST
jgi:hypothetical protein